MFSPDTIDKTCRICRETFKSYQNKKNTFLFHYGKQQIGGRGPRTSALLLNVLKRCPITYYSISFNQHKKFYDFFSTGVVDVFLDSVYETYRPIKENKIQGYAEIVN